jgi:hypothetical protein
VKDEEERLAADDHPLGEKCFLAVRAEGGGFSVQRFISFSCDHRCSGKVHFVMLAVSYSHVLRLEVAQACRLLKRAWRKSAPRRGEG